jgi:hypothetical protein
MTLLVIAVVLAVIAAGFVIHPLVYRRWGLMGDSISSDVLNSEVRKRVALAALKDVEYDRAAGKLDDTDYRELRSRLEVEALEAVTAAERAGSAAGEVVAHGCGFQNPGGSRFCAGCGRRLI